MIGLQTTFLRIIFFEIKPQNLYIYILTLLYYIKHIFETRNNIFLLFETFQHSNYASSVLNFFSIKKLYYISLMLFCIRIQMNAEI